MSYTVHSKRPVIAHNYRTNAHRNFFRIMRFGVKGFLKTKYLNSLLLEKIWCM